MNDPQFHMPRQAPGSTSEDERVLFLRDFTVTAMIGIYAHERAHPQRLRMNVAVHLRPPFEWRDRIEDVLDYDRLRQGILDILAAGHINLLETLGLRIVDLCFGHPQVCGVHVQIAKTEAHDDCEVGCEIRRRR
jgi:dihydroneopterin aldolase